MRPSLPLVAIVATGGAVGTAGRYAVSLGAPSTSDLPWTTLVVNLVGAFLLGLLLESLSRTGAETPHRRVVRLGLGTGVLGGFTTYSALALEVVELLVDGELARALGYGVGSVGAGLLACAAGIALATQRHGPRGRGAGAPS